MKNLTVRQKQVLALQARGYTNKQIAGMLGWCQGTIDQDMFRLRKQYNCSTQLELMYLFANAYLPFDVDNIILGIRR